MEISVRRSGYAGIKVCTPRFSSIAWVVRRPDGRSCDAAWNNFPSLCVGRE